MTAIRTALPWPRPTQAGEFQEICAAPNNQISTEDNGRMVTLAVGFSMSPIKRTGALCGMVAKILHCDRLNILHSCACTLYKLLCGSAQN